MKQKALKLGTETGSFFNWMMSKNSEIPEVGKGATQLHWTDRSPFEVLEVKEGGKIALLREMNHEAKPNSQMGDQDWILTPNPNAKSFYVYWKWNSWRTKNVRYNRTDKYWSDFEVIKETSDLIEQEQWISKYEDKSKFPEYFEKSTSWDPIRLRFGKAEYYYDYEF